MSGTSTDRPRRPGGEPKTVIRGRNITKADILVYPGEGGDLALKDFRGRPWWIRWTLGRWLIRRESAAYRALGPIPGLPEFLGVTDGPALATRWIDARPLAEVPRNALAASTLRELEDLVERVHRRGVALRDLHHRDILIDGRGGVHLVDLAAALVRGPAPGPLRRFLFDRGCVLDRIAVARVCARARGEDVELAARRAGGGFYRWYLAGRRLKRTIDGLRRRG